VTQAAIAQSAAEISARPLAPWAMPVPGWPAPAGDGFVVLPLTGAAAAGRWPL